jgi:hypothetical protein
LIASIHSNCRRVYISRALVCRLDQCFDLSHNPNPNPREAFHAIAGLTDCSNSHRHFCRTSIVEDRFDIQCLGTQKLPSPRQCGFGEETTQKLLPKPTSALASPHQTICSRCVLLPSSAALPQPPTMIERASYTTCTAASHRHR